MKVPEIGWLRKWRIAPNWKNRRNEDAIQILQHDRNNLL